METHGKSPFLMGSHQLFLWQFLIATLVITRPGIFISSQCPTGDDLHWSSMVTLPKRIAEKASKKDGLLNRKLPFYHETDVCVSST